MDQIIEIINGITHPTTLEKYQIMLRENLVLHIFLITVTHFICPYFSGL